MRLIDADAIDTSHSDPEVRETLDDAPTVSAVTKAEIENVIKKLDVDIAFYKAIRATGEASGMYHAKRYLQKLLKEIENEKPNKG